MTLPAFAAERRCLHHGACRYRSLSAADAANPSAAAAAVDRWDGQTDGRTDGRLAVT